MTDIVERLRAGWVTHKDAEEASAEIERLRAALREIIELCKWSPADPFLADNMDRVACRALEPKP